MRRRRLITAFALLILGGGAGAVRAQATGTAGPDSAVRRARQLADDGNSTAGRALLDSVMKSTPPGSPSFVEALFWHAMMAESPERARGDLLRVAVEYSLSLRAEDALLRLSRLELDRGDRAAAKKHLERLALEHGAGTSRAQRLFLMGRLLLEEGAVADGCASLKEAGVNVPAQDVELANQIAYSARPCASFQRALDSTRADSMARADSLTRADSLAQAEAAAKKAATAARSVPKPGGARSPAGGGTGKPIWSVQVAAYTSRNAAEELVRRLGARGYSARVTGEKPFRVRIGRFMKREDAVRLVEALKAAHSEAIIVEAEKP